MAPPNHFPQDSQNHIFASSCPPTQQKDFIATYNTESGFADPIGNWHIPFRNILAPHAATVMEADSAVFAIFPDDVGTYVSGQTYW
jgi:hypothetical protein